MSEPSQPSPPPSSSISNPSLPTKCHRTIRIYTCRHRTLACAPAITHKEPCPLSSNPSPTTSSPRCANMSHQAREIHVGEACSRCRPSTLGVGGQVREYEVFMPEFGFLNGDGDDLDDKYDDVEERFVDAEGPGAEKCAGDFSHLLSSSPPPSPVAWHDGSKDRMELVIRGIQVAVDSEEWTVVRDDPDWEAVERQDTGEDEDGDNSGKGNQ